jgi:hypothetical protein
VQGNSYRVLKMKTGGTPGRAYHDTMSTRGFGYRRSNRQQGLFPFIQPPQRLLHLDALANAVDIEGVIPGVPGEGTVAVCAEAAAIALSAVRVDTQARVIIRVEWAEIQPASPGWPGSVKLDQILDIVGLIVPGNGGSCAMWVGGGWPGAKLGWTRQCGKVGATVLTVGLVQLGERASGVLVDVDTTLAENEVAEAPGVPMACQRQPRDRVDGTWLDLPLRLTDRD